MSPGAPPAPADGATAGLKVALVHDYLVASGGAERTFLSICRLFPAAPVYTAMYRAATSMPAFAGREVRPLWTDHLPLDLRSYRLGVAAYPLAFRGLRLEGVDLVISSSSGFAKSAGSGASAHLAYVHTPPRFVWPVGSSSNAGGVVERLVAAGLRPLLRAEDLRAAAAATTLVANSARTAERIARFYGREALIVHPPVDTALFTPDPSHRKDDYYLAVGRLVPYKGFDEVVAECTASRRRLVVVGTGRERVRLERLAGRLVDFAGNVSDAELVRLYRGARALLLAGEDDWGMTPLEANACGCPVVAAARGGSLESVRDGINGILYEPGPEGLHLALERFESMTFDPGQVVAYAHGFDEAAFHRGILAAIGQVRA